MSQGFVRGSHGSVSVSEKVVRASEKVVSVSHISVSGCQEPTRRSHISVSVYEIFMHGLHGSGIAFHRSVRWCQQLTCACEQLNRM